MSAHTVGRLVAERAMVATDGPAPWWLKTESGQAMNMMTEHDARRLAACWNACEGVLTDHLISLDDVGGVVGLSCDVAHAPDVNLLQRELNSAKLALVRANERFYAAGADRDQARAELAELKTHLGTVKALTDERNDLKARLGNSADWNQREAELATARALLAEMLTADDIALAGMREMGMDPEACITDLTERVRAFLHPTEKGGA